MSPPTGNDPVPSSEQHLSAARTLPGLPEDPRVGGETPGAGATQDAEPPAARQGPRLPQRLQVLNTHLAISDTIVCDF